jgi:hypothetical protein
MDTQSLSLVMAAEMDRVGLILTGGIQREVWFHVSGH